MIVCHGKENLVPKRKGSDGIQWYVCAFCGRLINDNTTNADPIILVGDEEFRRLHDDMERRAKNR